jgi:UV DNA damage endonuclease
MIRLGLCCLFKEQPIRFRTTTAAYLKRREALGEDPYFYLSQIILDNLTALQKAILFCASHHIGCFRITSTFFPLYTHPDFCYTLAKLPHVESILQKIESCRRLASDSLIRLSLHPDQFVILNSPSDRVIENSVAELNYHADLAEGLGVDVINIHAGGVYGDKTSALNCLRNTLERLPQKVRDKLTLENDDKSYTPQDLLPICQDLRIPFVYDVHHHRCLPDKLSIEEATDLAWQTWNREPLFHLSSPLEGWEGRQPYRHHDYIDLLDFPLYWQRLLSFTVEIEAKAKESAIGRLYQALKERQVAIFEPKQSEKVI